MAMELTIDGVVQGVFCRSFCAQVGRKLGIRGATSNKADGTVQVLLDTDNEQDVEKYIHTIRTNPDGFRFHGTIRRIDKNNYTGPIYGDYQF